MEFTTLRSTQRENSKVSKYPSSSNYFAIFDPPADIRFSDVFHAFSELKFQSCEMHWQLARITEYENSAKILNTADIHSTKICLNIFDSIPSWQNILDFNHLTKFQVFQECGLRGREVCYAGSL